MSTLTSSQSEINFLTFGVSQAHRRRIGNMEPSFRFPIAKYLARVGLESSPRQNEKGLYDLHQAQFFSIPFENFTIQLGRPVSLQPQQLIEKLIYRQRGGYCFELNGLLLMALRELGFSARPLLARVHLGPKPSGRTHQLSLVEIDHRPWLIDVGFGAGGLRAPMPLEADRVCPGPNGDFRFEAHDQWGWMMRSQIDGEWRDSYSFDLSYVAPADIEVGNHFTSTAPTSHFTRNRIASLPRETGRVSLLDYQLTEIEGSRKRSLEVAPGTAYLDRLKSTFGIELDASYEDLAPLPSSEPRTT